MLKGKKERYANYITHDSIGQRRALEPDRRSLHQDGPQAGRGGRMSRYAQSALERETQAIVSTGEGGRRNQLNASSFSAGQLVGAGGLELPQAEEALLEAALSTGLDEIEALRTVRDGLKDGMARPRDLSRVESRPDRHSFSSAPTVAPRPLNTSSKLEQAKSWGPLSSEELEAALEKCTDLELGSPAHQELERRGLLEVVTSGCLAAWQRKKDGALVLAITDLDGQILALKARRTRGKQRYDYDLSPGHGTPPICFPRDTRRTLVIEGELNAAAALTVALRAGLELNICGVAGAGSIPHPGLLEGHDVLFLADRDSSGGKALGIWPALALECGALSAATLTPLESGDLCDFLGAQGPEVVLEWLKTAITQATPWQPQNDSEVQEAPPTTETHPTLNNAALHGLAGHVVRVLDPSTEADPVAVLMTFMVVMGAFFGDRFYIRQGGRHPLRIWVVLVGVSAKGRKGTSWQAVKLVLEQVFEDGWQLIIKHGLSSGEGLIYAVRDAVSKMVKNKEGVLEEQLVDQGVSDKRAFIKEEEFGSVLKVVPREGNTLSAVVRQGFDMGQKDTLQVMTKNSPNVATGAHIGILGHIVKDELLRYLEDTETANGFANRFLWMSVQRSKILPFGGFPDDVALEGLAKKVRKFVAWAERGRDRELTWSDDGRAAWAAVYGELSGDVPGLAGALLARAEANVLRLTGLFAMLDCTLEMTAQHLDAALAIWEYAEDSSTGIFGQRFGDPVADALITEIRSHPEGLTKTELSNALGRNTSAARLDNALNLLLKSGRVLMHKREAKGGRGAPAQVYRVRG